MLRSMILRVILIYYSQDFFLRSMPPTPAIPLHLLPFKRWGRIVDLATPASDHPSCKKDHSDASQGLLEQLVSIGFAPGEQVCILAAGKPGNEPLVVRIGTSTFALRRSEASCVLVTPLSTTTQHETPDA